ncbi:unnamed protein product [Protopolystoma xenopodis]|uniref:Uncharacterized protein n=1 Tax=Protopolystoma xenopodis TaxID=117903 RepID=A0A3S5B6M8_9PLAT|nr:unnamed protein product [Protopolystoma xenopodis]
MQTSIPSVPQGPPQHVYHRHHHVHLTSSATQPAVTTASLSAPGQVSTSIPCFVSQPGQLNSNFQNSSLIQPSAPFALASGHNQLASTTPSQSSFGGVQQLLHGDISSLAQQSLRQASGLVYYLK